MAVLSPRRFALVLAALGLAAPWALAGANLAIDPYAVLGTSPLRAESTPNSRYLSYRDYARRRGEVNALMLGSSRVGCGFADADLNGLAPGARFARIWGAAGEPSEYLQVLRAVLNAEPAPPLRLVIVLIDPDNIGWESGDRSVFARAHPEVTGQRQAAFAIEALFAPSWRQMSRKIQLNAAGGIEGRESPCDRAPGLRAFPRPEPPRELVEVTRRPRFAAHVAALAEIAALARARNIRLVVVTAPLHPWRTLEYDVADQRRVIERLAAVVPLWHFTTPPWLAENPDHWADPGHFTRAIGRLMIARALGQPGVEVPADFGRLIGP